MHQHYIRARDQRYISLIINGARKWHPFSSFPLPVKRWRCLLFAPNLHRSSMFYGPYTNWPVRSTLRERRREMLRQARRERERNAIARCARSIDLRSRTNIDLYCASMNLTFISNVLRKRRSGVAKPLSRDFFVSRLAIWGAFRDACVVVRKPLQTSDNPLATSWNAVKIFPDSFFLFDFLLYPVGRLFFLIKTRKIGQKRHLWKFTRTFRQNLHFLRDLGGVQNNIFHISIIITESIQLRVKVN